MIKVIIFDLDGLLIDSQPLQYDAYNQVFSKYGYPITKKEWLDDWIHNSISAKGWIEKKDLPLNHKKIRAEKKEIYNDLILSKMKLKPGAEKLIDLLSDNFPLCIASASMKVSIDIIADKFNFTSRFNKIVSDQEVHIEKSKPFPDVFLHMAEVMKVRPEECLVIEDSIAGLKAAKAAGMKCIVCPDTFSRIPLSDFKGADKIVKSLNNISLSMIDEISQTIPLPIRP